MWLNQTQNWNNYDFDEITWKIKEKECSNIFLFYPDALKLSDPKRIVQVTKLRTTKVNENSYSGNYFIRN